MRPDRRRRPSECGVQKCDLGRAGSKNANGNRIEGKQYNSDGILDYIVKFKYDINGNLIEQNQYNKKGELDYKVKIKYDINGYIIEENQYNSEGDILIEGIPSMYDYVELRYEYEFDDKENWIQNSLSSLFSCGHFTCDKFDMYSIQIQC